ncbi:MAG: hypothetical protein OXC55_02700 [Chloroflexi bacterium]|nr:hypothetical protein [Chloroflexota bacterium]
MTSAEVEILRKEIQRLFSYLHEMEQRMESRLYTVESRLSGRITGMEQRMDGMEQRMDGHQQAIVTLIDMFHERNGATPGGGDV